MPPDGPDAGDEFAIIARHFAPLAVDPAARALRDDVALLKNPGDLIVTTDAIIEGVHFLADDPLDLVARKALRVNLSDIAAKGGAPRGYLLTLAWPDGRDPAAIAALAAGLDADQRAYGVTLLGGDTTRTPGPLMLSVTLFGAPQGATPSRAGARVGDDVWVTGTIGDAGLGLDILRGAETNLPPPQRDYLVDRYRLPRPRTAHARLVATYASASCDLSDGLVGDAAKIAAASGLALALELAALPLSPPAAALAGDEGARARLAARGDDYEILFTAAAADRETILAAARGLDAPVTRIGSALAGAGARLIGASGPLTAPVGGYTHRLGGGR